MRRFLTVATLLAIATPAFAQSSEPEVTVTATKVSVPVENVGDDVDIITQEQIKEMGFTSITDVLKYVAGIVISSNGGPGQTTSLYMLGLPTKHVLLMVDGVPVYDPSTPDAQPNLSYIDLSNVERIEVLKGSQGALYGSDAVAGVINIITKKPKSSTFSLNFEGGKYKTFKENIYSALKLKNGFLVFTGEGFKTNGFSATNRKSRNYEPDNDGYRYKTGWFSFGWDPTSRVRMTGNVKVKGGSVDYDSSFVKNAKTSFNQFFANLKVDTLVTDKLTVSTLLGNNRELRNYGSDFVGIVRYFSLQPVYYLTDNLFITGGANYRQEKAEIPSRHSVNLKSLFLEAHGEYYGLYLTGAVRRDFHSTFGDKTTYKVSAAYGIEKTGTTLKGEYGTGFRAPSIYQLYGYGGNENLKAETSEGWIVGVKQSVPEIYGVKASLEVDYFKNHVWNIIDWDYTFPITSWGGYRNYKKAITEGTEVKLSVKPCRYFSIFGNYTHTRAKEFNGVSWSKLARRPKFNYTIGIKSGYKNVKFSVWALHYSDREDSNGKTLGGFTTYNCYVSYALNDRVNIYAKGVNLTDKDYELAYGYNTMGRALFVGTDFRF